MTDLFSQPVLPAMTDVHLPLNLNIQAFRGEQLRLTGDTDITVYNLLLKVSSIDGQMKLDALDIDSDQGKVSASGSAQLQDNWPVDITLAGTLNVDPMKGEKVQLKVGGEVRKTLKVGVDLSGPVAATLRADAQLAEVGLPLNMELKSKQLAAVQRREAVSGRQCPAEVQRQNDRLCAGLLHRGERSIAAAGENRPQRQRQ